MSGKTLPDFVFLGRDPSSAEDQTLPLSRPTGIYPNIPPSCLVWVNPRTVTPTANGRALSVPNSASNDPSALFVFPSGGTGTTPLWTPTRFNGTHPGLGWDGLQERRLETTLPKGGFGNNFTCIFAVNTFGGSFNGNLGFSNIFETARDASDIVSGIIPGPAGPPAIVWELERFDDTGAVTHAGDTAPGAVEPYVYAATIDHAAGIIKQFINGTQISSLTQLEGVLSPQTIVTLGGHSNAVDASIGPLFSQFELGDLMIYDSLLSASDFNFWQRFVGSQSGITWP